jgi:hypothetical protein
MINDYSARKRPDFFISRDCPNLLVTIGDSWTWGDSLGKCRYGHDDDLEARKNQCFGKTMSQELEADWLNIGFCGAGNGYIIKCLDDLVSGQHVSWLNQCSYDNIRDPSWPLSLQEVRNSLNSNILKELRTVYCQSSNPYTEILGNYKNVYIVLTLTETGRDASRYDWMYATGKVRDYIIQEEIYNFTWLNTIISNCKYRILVARNFTIDLKATADISPCISKNWLQINWEHNGQDYPKNIDISEISIEGPVSGVVFNEPFLANFSDYKQWFIDQISKAEPLWDYLRNNSLNHNGSTCHPTHESHVLWANYLLDRL